MVGFISGKVISTVVVFNKFTRCDIAAELNNDTEVHDFLCNTKGNSKSM